MKNRTMLLQRLITSTMVAFFVTVGWTGLGFAEPAHPHRDAVFDRLDRNNNGNLGPREKKLGRTLRHQKEIPGHGPKARKERRIHRADKNHDGVVGPRERHVARKHRPHRPR